MIDMSQTTAPKSDQLNYDDFLSGSRNILVTDVKIPNPDADQPASIHFEGDKGKPYRPCKSMRRILIEVWGSDGLQYRGKSMTLYGDKNVMWGGKKVGGIRISHMSHIKSDKQVLLSISKTKRALFTIKPLIVDMKQQGDVQETTTIILNQDAKTVAENGDAKYRKYFGLLSTADKQALINSGDHEKLKELSQAMDKEPVY